MRTPWLLSLSPLKNSCWHLLRSGPRSTAANMALDEVLLEHCATVGGIILRFYGWNETGATFGYSQRFAQVALLTALRPLVRRPTGGGLVAHAGDWTYSLAVPPTDPWYRLKAVQSYRQLHAWLAESLSGLGLATELALSPQPEGPGQCFVGAERFDLLWHQRKLAGAAQRRTRQGLLIQGSIQPPPAGVAEAAWQKAMCDVARARWGIEWLSLVWTPSLEARVEALAREKYATLEHNRRR